MCLFEIFFMIPGLLYYVYKGMGFGYDIVASPSPSSMCPAGSSSSGGTPRLIPP
ncbi:hypothetical protein [Candidatus Methanomethylophilus sp. 1R26]|uniref:hypothetical protein n=1 Tax=Candidatus Methanomethylophilus sp. 1R26 TaxID=1769296 RepID=UPI001910E2B0|nr:hypothetical protein [Candidatus Methanomethylophilus sp. 1R26]